MKHGVIHKQKILLPLKFSFRFLNELSKQCKSFNIRNFNSTVIALQYTKLQGSYHIVPKRLAYRSLLGRSFVANLLLPSEAWYRDVGVGVTNVGG